MSEEESEKPAPGASQRKLCYNAKDRYYECMVKNNESMEACKELMDKFHSSCLKSWVIYFERKREYEKFKTKMLEMGAEPLEIHWKEGDDK